MRDSPQSSEQNLPTSSGHASDFGELPETLSGNVDVEEPTAPSSPADARIFSNRAGLDLIESFAFVFSSRDGVLNLALGFVCMLLPQLFSIVGLFGVVVFWGYSFQIVESRIKYPGSIYPTFEFRELGGYMHRAVWPFLITLPFWLWWAMQFMFWYFMLILSVIFAVDPGQADESRAVMAIAVPSVILLMIVCSYVAQLIFVPMILRAGLTRNFTEAFRIRWVLDFIKRTWLTQLATFVFLFSMSWILAITGGILGCVGLFAAQAWSLLAFMHLSWQVYDIYLYRGGTPIELYVPPPRPIYIPPNPDGDIPVGDVV